MFKYELNQKVWVIRDYHPRCGVIISRRYADSIGSPDGYKIYDVRLKSENKSYEEALIFSSKEELLQRYKDEFDKEEKEFNIWVEKGKNS